MGFWKNVAYDISRGMSKQTAIELNAELRYGNLTSKEKAKKEALAEAEVKLKTMRNTNDEEIPDALIAQAESLCGM